MRITDGSREVLVSTPTIKTEREFRAAYAKGQLQADGEIDVRSAQAAFDQTVLPPIILNLEACDAQVQEAQRGGFRNLGALHWALGPEIYQLRQDYKDATRRNYHRALKKMLEHAVSQRRQEVYQNFATTNRYPTQLSTDQQAELKKALASAFDPRESSISVDDLALPSAWVLREEFSESCQQIADNMLQAQFKYCQDEDVITNLPTAFFNEKQRSAKLQIELTELAQQQRNLHKKYNNDVGKAWGNFKRKFTSLSTVDQRIADLKACGIAELSINDLAGGPALFDSAVQAYATAKDDDEKKAGLACLQELVAHGAKPTDESVKQLDALALSKLLPLGAAPTAQVQAARAKTTKQLERRAGFSWFWLLMYSSQEQRQYLDASKKIVVAYLVARDQVFSLEQEKRLLLTAARPLAGSSSLWSGDTSEQRLLGGTELATYGSMEKRH